MDDEEAIRYRKYEHVQVDFVNQLKNALNIRYVDENNVNRVVKWNGLQNERGITMRTKRQSLTVLVAHALSSIPRSAFVPKNLQSVANYGQHLHFAVNGAQVDMTSMLAIARSFEALDLLPGHKFLDVGCGTGYTTAVAALIIGNNNNTFEDINEAVKNVDQSKSSLGIAVGVDIDAKWVDYSRDRVIEFSRTSERRFDLDIINFQNRNVFQRIIRDGQEGFQVMIDLFMVYSYTHRTRQILKHFMIMSS